MFVDLESRFGPRGRAIRDLAIAKFFDQERQWPSLRKVFNRGAPLDQMLYWRRRPYKFGAKLILGDTGGANAEKYHVTMYTGHAFELMKVLSDIADTITDDERGYLKKKINDCIADKGKDIASVYIEAHLFHSLRAGSERISIGDGEHHPDLRLTAGAVEFDIQCKSVSIGRKSEKALEGFHRLTDSMKTRQAELAAAATHSAWQVVDSVALADAHERNDARDLLLRYCAACAEGRRPEGMATDTLRLLGDAPANRVALPDFITTMDGAVSFWTPRAAVACNVFLSALPPDTEWSFAFYAPRDIREMVDRCEKRFEEAMRQHETMGSKKPVVVINVEASMFIDDAAVPTGRDPLRSPVVHQALEMDRRAINERIARNRKWKHCYGVVLVFNAPPLYLPSGGVFWRRMLSWSSPTGGEIDSEFPVLRRAMSH